MSNRIAHATPIASYIAAAALIAFVGLRAHAGDVEEILWACYIADLVMAVGLLTGVSRLVDVGFLFHATAGAPLFVVGIVLTGSATAITVALHVLPLLFGIAHLRGRIWFRQAGTITSAMYLLALALSAWFTEPRLNVNALHNPWPGVPTFMRIPWIWMLLVVGAPILLILAGNRLVCLIKKATP